MDTPQEVEVWFILPAVRKQLAIEMKKTGMKQKDIASALNITGAAVSQYLTKKRGEEITFDGQTLAEVSESAERIRLGEPVRTELQRLMQKIKKSRLICSVCHDQINTSDSCEICYM